jgi:hypothetical protein
MMKHFFVIVFAMLLTACSDDANFDADKRGACRPSNGRICTEKKGLSEGQSFRVLRDMVAPAGHSERFSGHFVNGQQIAEADLLASEGQDYCYLSTTLQGRAGGLVTSEYANSVEEGTYQLYWVTWFTDTIYFQGENSFEDSVRFGIVCGEVRNGNYWMNLQNSETSSTSLGKIKRHLKGWLEIVN